MKIIKIKLMIVKVIILFLSFLTNIRVNKNNNPKTPKSPIEESKIEENELLGLILGLNQPLKRANDMKKFTTKKEI